MDCSEAKSHLSAFASGLTNDLDRTEIEEHLTSCEACSLEVELLRGRAAGQPAAAKPSDWTLEKIFGNEANGEAGAGDAASVDAAPIEHDARVLESSPSDSAPAPAPAATSAAATTTAHPSLILPPPPMPSSNEETSDAKPAGAKGKAKSGSWDFEPADAGKDAAPPEESLAFAEEALNRKRGGSSKSKAAAMRMLVWSLGGVAGLALLGVSAWIAMAVHQAPPREIATGAARSAPTSGDAEATETAPERPIQAKVAPGLSAPLASPTPANPDASTPAPSTPPAPGGPTATTTIAPAGTTPAPSAPSATPTPKAAPASPKAPRDAAAPKKVAVATPAPAKPAKRDDDDMWPTDDPIRSGSAASGAASPKSPAAGTTTAPAPSHAATTPVAPAPKADVDVAPPAAGATPPSTAPPTADAKAPSAPLSPIDRLHLATEKASEDRDLTSLRQLKTGWKALLRTTVGRDRSRTKREYADCLWEIQGLTGRDADRLECLNAYRDYLLSAPAGGTDTRSAERLRQLEDALHEGD